MGRYFFHDQKDPAARSPPVTARGTLLVIVVSEQSEPALFFSRRCFADDSGRSSTTRWSPPHLRRCHRVKPARLAAWLKKALRPLRIQGGNHKNVDKHSCGRMYKLPRRRQLEQEWQGCRVCPNVPWQGLGVKRRIAALHGTPRGGLLSILESTPRYRSNQASLQKVPRKAAPCFTNHPVLNPPAFMGLRRDEGAFVGAGGGEGAGEGKHREVVRRYDAKILNPAL